MKIQQRMMISGFPFTILDQCTFEGICPWMETLLIVVNTRVIVKRQSRLLTWDALDQISWFEFIMVCSYHGCRTYNDKWSWTLQFYKMLDDDTSTMLVADTSFCQQPSFQEVVSWGGRAQQCYHLYTEFQTLWGNYAQKRDSCHARQRNRLICVCYAQWCSCWLVNNEWLLHMISRIAGLLPSVSREK